MTAAARRTVAAPAPATSPAATGALLGALIGPTAFGVTAASVAVADAAASLNASEGALAWPITVYVAALALSGAVAGRLLLVIGGRRVASAGAALLTVGAVGVLASPSLPVLTVSRALLGAGAGAMATIALALAGAAPEEERPVVLGGLSAVMAAAIGAGPVLGGVLALSTWRVAFALPVVSLGALAVLLGRTGELPPAPGALLDGVGVATLVAAAGGLILTLQVPVSDVPAALALVLALVTGVAIVRLARHTAAHADGILPAAVVRRRDLRPWWVTAAGAQAGQFSSLLLLPSLLDDRFGWSTPVIGAVLAGHALAGVAAARLVSRSVDGPIAIRAVSAIAIALGAGLVAVSLAGPRPGVLFAVAALAFAIFTAVQVVAVYHVSRAVPDDMVGPATGILSLVFLTGGATGAALTSVAADRWGAVDAGWMAAVPPLVAGVAVLFAGRRPLP